jgi:hypothetical protein
MSNESFTMAKLKAAMRLVENIPPPPLFVSSKHLPADNALAFKHGGRDYVGAHPDFWGRLKDEAPEALTGIYGDEGVGLHGIPIWNIDFHSGRAEEFYQAMGKALAKGKP